MKILNETIVTTLLMICSILTIVIVTILFALIIQKILVIEKLKNEIINCISKFQ